jgi:hypothetical protein
MPRRHEEITMLRQPLQFLIALSRRCAICGAGACQHAVVSDREPREAARMVLARSAWLH